jgi:hypothetical protein
MFAVALSLLLGRKWPSAHRIDPQTLGRAAMDYFVMPAAKRL